jgi:hypothetical protein
MAEEAPSTPTVARGGARLALELIEALEAA